MKEARLPERPLRVAMLLTELGPGGAERVVLELSKELKARGHSPLVVSLTPPPSNRSVPDALAGAGIETRYASLSKRAPWNLLRLAGILREAKPDLLHSHLMHPNIAARLLKPFFGCPLLNTVHIADRRAGMRPWFLMDRLTFPLCDACAAVSKAAASFHEAALGLAPGSLEVVYNGLDPVDAAPPETLAALKAEWGLAGCSRVIGSIGRLDWQKGYDLLLGMLPALSAKVPAGEKWGVLIIGEGPERAGLEALAAKAPPNLLVRLPGFRADAARLPKLFDVFAMPSRYEGYGLALVEAMACGVPVVCSNVDSLPELCALYPASALVDFPGEAACDALVGMANGRVAAKPFHAMSVAAMCDAYLALYGRLLSKEGRTD